MTSSDAYVPLKLIECENGSLRGKVRLQKLAFLVQEASGAVNYEFNPAPLGPLSYSLNVTMAQLQDLGMVEEKSEGTASGNTVFCYGLTGRGRAFLSAMDGEGQVDTNLRDAVVSTYKAYGGMGYVELLDLVHERYPQYHLKGVSISDFIGSRGD